MYKYVRRVLKGLFALLIRFRLLTINNNCFFLFFIQITALFTRVLENIINIVFLVFVIFH